MRSMTRAHLHANWSGVPSLNQPWLVALLRAFAMLVLYAASIVRTCLAVADRRRRMRFSLLSGECHTDVEPDALPEQQSGIFMETKEVAESSLTIAQRQLTCAPPTPPTTAPVFPPIRRSAGTRTGDRTGHRTGDCNFIWNFIANPDSGLRTDIARI